MSDIVNAGSSAPSATTSATWAWRLAALLGVCLFFAGSDRDYWGSDEPRVAALSLSMAESGEYAVPRLGAEAFVEKPPLYFIVAAFSVEVLGEWIGNVLAIRLTSILWGLATVWCAYRLARLIARDDAADDARAPPSPQRAGLVAAVILSTTAAFVSNSGEVRTDISLACLCTAAVWAFAEAYLANRPRMLLLAGVLLAGAFLTKGPIALMFVGSAWLGLFPLWLYRRTRPGKQQPLYFGTHVTLLALFLAGVGAWIFCLLRAPEGQELFDEWFWRNQIGRADGTAGLGHTKGGGLLFYIQPLLMHSMPWAPLMVVWLFKALRSPRRLTSSRIMLLVWFVVPVLLLSVMSTRRDVYILPLTPVMALMSADLVSRLGIPGWCRGYLRGVVGLLMVGLAAVALLPLLQGHLPSGLQEELGPGSIDWSVWNGFAALGLIVTGWLGFTRRSIDPVLRCAFASAIAFLSASLVTTPLFDLRKSDRPRVVSVGEQFSAAPRDRVAGFGFRERWRALFFVHLDWAVPQVERDRLQLILQGRDPQYTSVIVQGDRLPEDLEAPAPVVLFAEAGDEESLHGGAFTWYEPGPAE